MNEVRYEYETVGIPFQKLGFWIFLAGEIVILGSLVAAGMLFRLSYPEWHLNHEHVSPLIGSINTLVLLTGSLTVVLAHRMAQRGNWEAVQAYLLATIICGAVFLGIKTIEYTKEIKAGFVPWLNPFWMFYFGITGIHGAHVLAGTLIIAGVMIYLRKKKLIEAVENTGLYWHFVDIVWLYIFPLFYLT